MSRLASVFGRAKEQRRVRYAHSRVRFPLVLLLLLLFAASGARAQNAQVQVDRGPHYLGEPIVVQVVASQFEDEPTPEVEVGSIDGASIRFAGVSDSSSTSISIVNGRMTRTKEVRFIYQYEVVSTREGRLDIPPFTVRQGGVTRKTRPLALSIQTVPTTGLVGIEVEVRDGPLFVGQKVPVEVVLRIDREAERDLISLTAAVPLFDQPSLRFIDDPSVSQDTTIDIQTAAGVLRLPATTVEKQQGGRRILEVRAKRTLIALSPERIRASAPRIVINRGTRFRRDLFNQRQATSSERLMAEGKPVSIEVLEVPRVGRPPSFAGAVGEGFSLEVSADRSVVQLGEPIVLSFLLRGDGDLSTAGLPRFDAEGLFDPQQFRLPEEPPAGLVDEDGKRFEASLRVIDSEVREVPAIAYSWFDAKTRQFETTYSRPIALSVGAAQIISASDVDRRIGDAAAEDRIPASGEAPGAVEEAPTARSSSLSVSGANLAVDSDPARVLGGKSPAATPSFLIPLVYGLAFVALAYSFFDHRRRSRDPEEVARGAAFEVALRGIDEAAAADAEGAAMLGRCLRELVARLPEEASEEIDRLVSECDALRFAPAGVGSGLPAELVERARSLVAEKGGLE